MRYLFFFIVLIISLSCTKFGKNFTVKGRVMNPITGEGISDIRVFMYKATSTSLPADYKTVKEVHTDSDGSFELNKLGLSKYYVKCDVPGDYYLIGWDQKDGISLFDKYTLSVKKGKTMHVDYYAVPYGNLQININNTSCFDSSDNIKLYFDSGPYDSRTFNPGLITSLDGCVNIPGTPVKSSMGYKYFHWEVIKNSVSTIYYDTVFVNEGGTTILDINY